MEMVSLGYISRIIAAPPPQRPLCSGLTKGREVGISWEAFGLKIFIPPPPQCSSSQPRVERANFPYAPRCCRQRPGSCVTERFPPSSHTYNPSAIRLALVPKHTPILRF